METSLAFRTCVRQSLYRSAHYKHIASGTKSVPRTTQVQSSSRSFSSSSSIQQDTPPQPQPVSQEKSAAEAVGAIPTNNQVRSRTRPDPSKRIDLSSLPGIPSSYAPPSGQSQTPTQTKPESAKAKLDSLFGTARRADEDPFRRAIRQTDALNKTSALSGATSSQIIKDLLENMPPYAKGSNASSSEPAKLPLRLKPTLGRSQSLNDGRGIDLTRAFRMLEMKCTQNSVKRDLQSQRFHVRRGQRRKLLRSVRWRAAFKAGFLEECARVRRMKNQGW